MNADITQSAPVAKLAECPPGLFLFQGELGFKDEYGGAYCVHTGEAFWGGTQTPRERDTLLVRPMQVTALSLDT